MHVKQVAVSYKQGQRNDFKSVWARPEKADGGGGGGGLRHIFFLRTSNFFDIYI